MRLARICSLAAVATIAACGAPEIMGVGVEDEEPEADGGFPAEPLPPPEPPADASLVDAGQVDAGQADVGQEDASLVDAGHEDAGHTDANQTDAGAADAGRTDAGAADAGPIDAGEEDASLVDAGHEDAGHADANQTDAGAADAGRTDAGAADAGPIDAGRTDAGQSLPDGGWRSVLFPEDWKPLHAGGTLDSQGKFLPDFSYAGYHRGEQRPPWGQGAVVATVDAAKGDGAQDATAAIQAAINAGCAAGGGVVRIPAGTYVVRLPTATATQALLISCSRLVLRGEGPARTRILFDDALRARSKSVLAVRGSGTDSATALPLAADVLTPTRLLRLSSTTGLSVGDWVIVRNDITDAFRAEHRMDQATSGLAGLWPSSNFSRLQYFRRLVSVAADRVELDAPIHYPLRLRDNARLLERGPVLEEVGVESLAFGMVENKTTPTKTDSAAESDYTVPGTTGYEVHDSRAVTLTRIRDSWLYDVDTFLPAGNTTGAHVLSHGIQFDSTSSRITVQDCDLGRPQYRGGGGNGYLFHLQGHDLLIANSTTTQARHGICINQASSGNVFLRMTLNNSRYSDDSHRFLAHANLYDSIRLNQAWLQSLNRATTSGGAGFTGTQHVFWNTHVLANHPTPRGCAVESEQWGHGYLIGSSASSGSSLLCVTCLTNATWCAADSGSPQDHVEGEGRGASLFPASLYEAQRQLRCERDRIACSP